MSLFGDEPNSAPARSKTSLFDEAAPATKSGSGLFADDGDSGQSPWNFPTPKKAARGDLVKTLLPATDVPESYIDAYDSLLRSSDSASGGVGLTGVKRLLENSSISPEEQQKILSLVVPVGQESTAGLGRGEFNVLVALVGLAQEGEDVTLDSVDERRKRMLLSGNSTYSLTNLQRPKTSLNRVFLTSRNQKLHISPNQTWRKKIDRLQRHNPNKVA